MVFSNSGISFSSFAASSSVASSALQAASLGMAFIMRPPCREYMSSPTPFTLKKCSSRPIMRLAFPLYLSISPPECPPWKPLTSMLYFSPDFFVYLTGTDKNALRPPAELERNTPSLSLSRFNRYFALRSEVSNPVAPTIPTSSSAVNTSSSGGWTMDLSSIIAKA